MKTYKDTKAAVKNLVLTVGLKNILCRHINELTALGHDSRNVHKALNYFTYSPQTASYR